MIDIRLVASDVDGTMLPANGAISENLRRAIARCLDRGIPFILSSGRWIVALGRIIESCGVGGQPMIIANGAAVLAPDGVPLREWTLCESDARLAFDVMRRYDVQINSYVRNGLYCLNTRVLARQATMIRDYIGTGHARLSLDDPAAFEAFALTAPYKLEAMTDDERFAFWRGELSKCIRCNACRNVCPACSCVKCVFDNPNTGVQNKAAADDFEENLFHIIRAFHVAGRCTDCGECSRVCPQGIPLHLLNRKFISDIDDLYGEYQAGEAIGQRHPLIDYTQADCEPSIVHERGNNA